jgi:hypothetical protein
VYEQPPTGSYSHSFTGYTGVAADHLRRHAENEQKRATQSNAQERARQKYEQPQPKSQSPKQRSKSPSKKRSASPTSPEPPERIKRDTGSPPSNCPSFKKYPVRPTGDKKTKKIQLRKQYFDFHPDLNSGCSEAATEKTKLLNKYKDEDPMLVGGKSKRKSKRASKRTAKKRSGK